MAKVSFRERIQHPDPILADGAMATLLHQRGSSMSACFESLNLADPEIVIKAHMDYIKAGSRLIQTNTFGANRYKLGDYGLGQQVAEVNKAAVQIVKKAIERSGCDDVYIAGDIGPLGVNLRPYGRLKKEDMQEAFREQVVALVDAGIDTLLLETFSDHAEILTVIDVIKDILEERGVDIPIIAQMTFANDGYTTLGRAPARVANDLYKVGVDIIGVNCGVGPSKVTSILQSMRNALPEHPLSVLPNAGFPESVGGRIMYPATADYFGDYALAFKGIGASIIGGCCGTTPAHIAAMREALDDPTRTAPHIQVSENGHEEAQGPVLHPTHLAQRLAEGKFTVTVEMSPPRSYTAEKLVDSAHLLREAGADMLNIADTPAARMRMSAWAVAHVLQSRVGMETVLHFPTRGRNLLRVQGDLLAAHALDLRNLFVTMGDPTRIGDYPDAMDEYDIVPSGLIELIKHKMNAGVDMAGSSIGNATNFTVGCALNMFADDLDREIRVLGKKLRAGADFALGQAVFEPHKIETFLKRYEKINEKPFDFPVIISIIPLYSLRQAMYLHHEVPGIQIPQSIMKRMEDAGDSAPYEGVKIAQELLRDVKGMVAGAYIMPAFDKYRLAAEVVDSITT